MYLIQILSAVLPSIMRYLHLGYLIYTTAALWDRCSYLGIFRLPMRKQKFRLLNNLQEQYLLAVLRIQYRSSTASGSADTLKSKDLFSISLQNLNWTESTSASLGQMFISINERRLSGFVFFMLLSFQTTTASLERTNPSCIPIDPCISLLSLLLNLHFIHLFNKQPCTEKCVA